jgi:hypothetical protein
MKMDGMESAVADGPRRANGMDRAPRPRLMRVPNVPRVPAVRRFPDEVVAAVRDLVTGTPLPLSGIARQTGVSESTVKNWLAKHNWQRPAEAPRLRSRGVGDHSVRRARLQTRLYRVLSRQLDAIEARARREDGETIEKDARTLGVLAKTLETLNALGRDDGARMTEPEFADRDELDAALAKRIKHWAESGT